MIRLNLCVEGIPIFCETGKMVVAVHGNMSNKADEPIVLLAEAAIFFRLSGSETDLPQHGRKEEPTLCKVQNCVHDLGTIMNYVRRGTKDVSLFACSMGLIFSLLAPIGMSDCARVCFCHRLLTWAVLSKI